MSPEQHQDAYHSAAQRLGAKRGFTPEYFLDDAGRRLESYDYPTASCLLPEDIVAFSTSGTLLDRQRSHVDTCHFCRDLLEALTPSQERIAALRDIVVA